MKIIVDLLGFRREIEVNDTIFARGEILFPIQLPLMYAGDASKNFTFRFEFKGYQDGIPIFILENRQLKLMYEALGGSK